MSDAMNLREELRARPIDGVLNLAGYSTDATTGAPSKSKAKKLLEGDMADDLFDAHELVFAEEERSVLLVLQGLDCSGKNGTIKHVVISMNPAGVRVASFQAPTKEEQEQHFLQRCKDELPKPGQLGVFDRSYYEDAIVPMALSTLDEKTIAKRIKEINEFEKKLVDDGTVVVKCLLNISFDEQRERFLRRLRRDDKRWKFSAADVETRTKWNDFLSAYGNVVAQTCPDHAPWYVIPADRKWYRNWAIGTILLDTFADMGASYPQPDFDIAALQERLEAPN